MLAQLGRLWRDEGGSIAIEYAIIGTSIAVVIVSGVSGIGLKLTGYFSEVSVALK